MSSVYIIAEAGVNHNGSLDMAHRLIDAAALAGVDAVKFQTFNAEKLASKSVKKAAYQIENTGSGESQFEMLKKLELSYDWHHELKQHANAAGLDFLSTAFDPESLEFLAGLDMPFIKVPSGEITNAPLLWKFARLRKKIVLSTGMATLSEVEFALAVINHAFSHDCEPDSTLEVWKGWSDAEARKRLVDNVVLLHCTSLYPTKVSDVNLKAMDTIANAFGLRVGYSDHTQGILMPIAAVARGAVLIEKHFTLDRDLPGPDHKASLEPEELIQMTKAIRDVSVALGDSIKAPQSAEWSTRSVARQQVIAARDIAAGNVISRGDLGTSRAGKGISASCLWDIVGSVANRSYLQGELIEF
ncbi:MAG: N-acetylneuraminate synthase [Candidatus Planktophila sp.]